MESLDLGSEEFERRLSLLFRQAMVGRCVNGVTHDVNNYLGAVLAYAELIGYEENLADESRRMLSEIVEGIKRSSDLLGTLTGIARKDRQRISICQVEDMLRHNLQLQQYTNRLAQIQIEQQFHTEPQPIKANASQLELAFLCLLHNAMEAVEEAPRRLIRLCTDYTDSHCTVEFWDSGPGLAGQAEDTLFQPYFTSKNTGHLGLGLPFASGVIKAHGGTLKYERGRGFVVTLPFESGLTTSR
jgi:two-component system C4-dicarboxylate transport sensor histidine kinase DctB